MHRLVYFINTAISGIRQAPFVNIITIGTIGLALFVFCSFLMIYLNMAATLAGWEKRIGVTVYLVEGADDKIVEGLAEKLIHIDGVANSVYISPDEALKIFRRQLGADSDILDGLDDNPLPGSFEITPDDDFRTPEAIEKLAAGFSKMKGVEDVNYGRDWIEKFAAFLDLLKFGGLVLGVMMLLAGTMIISNTIKLTVFARRDEIDIMRLVGATDRFIKLPFLLEGMIQAASGAVIALVAAAIVHYIFLADLAFDIGPGGGEVKLLFLSGAQIVGVFLGSVSIGITGSALALGRFLKS